MSDTAAGILARFLTLGGATVEITQMDDGFNRHARCKGCYYAEAKANAWAQEHAERCRAMPIES
jgi:hypothetical protein